MKIVPQHLSPECEILNPGIHYRGILNAGKTQDNLKNYRQTILRFVSVISDLLNISSSYIHITTYYPVIPVQEERGRDVYDSDEDRFLLRLNDNKMAGMRTYRDARTDADGELFSHHKIYQGRSLNENDQILERITMQKMNPDLLKEI